MQYPHVDRLRDTLRAKYAFLADQVDRNLKRFGDAWATEFDELLGRMFPGDEALAAAAKGYCDFALDGMRMMKRFEKERRYPAKTYEEAAGEVYHNADYMLNLYLPGNLLSHYLWPHHYRQLVFLRNSFLDDLRNAQDALFYDVGIGTGFYSRYFLAGAPRARGVGFDISDSSIEYTRRQVAAFGCDDRYRLCKRDVVRSPVEEPAPFVVCVEVLEHLEDPVALLVALRRMLAPGGKALITAAITAPNADHIYLYRDAEEVHAQVREAGFKLEQYFAAAAYPPRGDEPVPTIAAFIVV